MQLFDIKSLGIFNSQIFRCGTPISDIRESNLFEIELPIENGGISFIDNESEKITPRMIICAKPGQKRHTKFPFKCYYIHIHMTDSELAKALSRLPNFIQISDSETYINIYKSLITHCQGQSEKDRYMIHAQVLKLISLLLGETEHAQNAQAPALCSNHMETALGYIDDHLTEKLSLQKVAYAVSLSPVYFHNCFKKATGKTLHSYIEDKRIERSVYLMQTTDMTLTEIAYACGFSSQSYYSYAFKRRMKTTPRQHLRDLLLDYEK